LLLLLLLLWICAHAHGLGIAAFPRFLSLSESPCQGAILDLHEAPSPVSPVVVLKATKNSHFIPRQTLILKEHQNRITGLKVTVIFLNGWIFFIGQSGEASRWRVCYQQGLPRLVNRPGVAGAVL
jgi:hypothetical protein